MFISDIKPTQTYTCYDGSTIVWLDKESLKYTDNGHVAIIWVDYGPGIFKVSRVLKTESLLEWKELPDAGSKQINDAKKKEIILKVQLYFAFQKVKCEVDK